MAKRRGSNALKYHGGKSYLAPWIIKQMPPHTRYCETHFGGGAVLFAKSGDNVAEYANDISQACSHFWYVLREPGLFPEFVRKAEATEFSQPLFDKARERLKSRVEGAFARMPLDSAIDFFVVARQSRQALGKDFATPTTRLRRRMNEQVSAWLSAVEGLPAVHERLKRVEIRCSDANDFITDLDTPETLFYCDPPYVHSTRSTVGEYEHEMTPEQHERLLATLATIKGKFILSGYKSPMYEAARKRHGWRRVEKKIDNKASSSKTKEKRIECLWMNY